MSPGKTPIFSLYSTSLWIRFLRFSLIANKRLQEILETLDLTAPQLYVMATIGYAGQLPFNEIGAKMMVTVSNLTGIVDRLEEKGLVARERDTSDRRIVYVKLTSKGQKLYKTSIPTFENTLARLFEPLEKEEQKELGGLLKKLSAQRNVH